MNSLLTLAKGPEQKSRVQQQSASEMPKAAFGEHKKSVRTELNKGEEGISVAILSHDRKLSSAVSQRTKGMLRMVSQTRLTIVLVSVLLITSSAGIPWWRGQQILDNYTSIREQKDALEELNARTWDVRYQEDNQGRSLILSKGVRADTNQTFDNGRKNGIRLVQEQNSVMELEKQLLNALEQLQQGYSKRLDERENAFTGWRTMSGLMQRGDAALSEHVTGLSEQVQSLSEQLRRLSQS